MIRHVTFGCLISWWALVCHNQTYTCKYTSTTHAAKSQKRCER